MAYRQDLTSLVEFLSARETASDDIALVDLYALRAWLAQLSRTHAPSSVARKIAAVRSFMRWMKRRGLLAESPAEQLATPKVRRPLPTLLSVDAIAQVVESPDDTPIGRRDRALLGASVWLGHPRERARRAVARRRGPARSRGASSARGTRSGRSRSGASASRPSRVTSRCARCSCIRRRGRRTRRPCC